MGDPGGLVPADPARYQLFEAGWRRIHCPLSQLWAQYLGLGGNIDLFTLDAFLHGVVSIPLSEQDVLANAINEQLEDLYQAARIPYTYSIDTETANPILLAVFDELFGRPPPKRPDPAG